MNYFGDQEDAASSSEKTGVLLVNLGTPSAPTKKALRKYLGEFLMDPRVIELPTLFRTLLVKGIIVNFRSSKSAKNYQKVWQQDGSPLLVNCAALVTKVQENLGDRYEVGLAMSYGQPSIESALQKMHTNGVRDITIVPLYPQYSGSTNGSVFDGVSRALQTFRWVPNLRFINAYFHNPLYTQAIAESITQHWKKNGRADKLVLSFHGVPEKYIEQGDPYRDQCEQSALDIAKKLKLKDEEWILVFQSRFGAQKWLQPYCDETLKSLPAQGIKSVDIICPGFSVDCLETLEEIDQENREYFIKAGGEKYSYIACLNSSADHASLVADLVN